MNIFKGMLSEERMKRITNGSDCGARGDYLAWDPEQWQPTKEPVRYFDMKWLRNSQNLTDLDISRL